jgi:hypothetical protein
MDIRKRIESVRIDLERAMEVSDSQNKELKKSVWHLETELKTGMNKIYSLFEGNDINEMKKE